MSPYGQVLLTPMTLRAKRPSGLTSSTHVTFHHNSWTPAKADEAKKARERRVDLIIERRKGGGKKAPFQKQELELGSIMKWF